jgi:Mn2+/Fe2+ NRAMP family transporter
MCGRLGIVTGRGLADLIRIHFSKKILYSVTALLFIANSFNIGADLGAMSEATKLLLPNTPFVFWMLFFTLLSLGLQIFVPYKKYISFIKYLTLTLFSYIVVGLILNINWGVVLYELTSPQFEFTRDKVLLLCAILGTTISPYLFFWQPSQEIEEEIENGYVTINARSHYANNEIIKNMRFDTWFGMFFSNLVMFFIILVCGAVLFPAGVHNIQTAKEAAEALKPIAGDLSYYLFAFGIIGTGMLAIPVLAGSSAYALSEAFKKKEGLSKKWGQAKFFYLVIIISMLMGFAINFVGIGQMKALTYSAILNGLVAPVMLIFIVKLSSDKKIMREWVNSSFQKFLGWSIVFLMKAVSLAAILLVLFNL